ncbi:MAG: AMP-binding protein [Lentisphaeria bacterium]|nr:AMP-binding protein [Lentisphaeria bacterium]NQZ68585.1 AMP-binding protein [Lentisphaeria bacterium]
MRSLLALFVRLILSIKYRVKVSGLSSLKDTQGVLVLPNHPGEMDPAILISHSWGTFQLRPMMVEFFFNMPGLKQLVTCIKAIPIPSLEGGASAYKRMRVNESLDIAADALKTGSNLVIYPSGRLMRHRYEELGGASGVFEIVKKTPGIKIVAVRTTGLLDSSFAWVTHQNRPPLGPLLKNGLKWTLINLIFFNPRRHVNLHFEDVTDQLPMDDKLVFNKWLEDWYNKDGVEPEQKVSLSLWSKVYYKKAEIHEKEILDIEISDAVRSAVIKEISKLASRDAAEIKPAMSLMNDLGFDSLTLADMTTWLVEEFMVADIDPEDIITVHDVMAAASGEVRDTDSEPVKAPPEWHEENRPGLVLPNLEKNVPHNFLTTCDRMGKAIAMADDTMLLTYKKAKLAVLVLADVFRKEKEDRIGVMLPATAGSNLVIMAVLVAGKVPVMINWTLGDANFKHVLEISGIKRIVSSGLFLDRVEQLNFELLKEYLWTMEDIKKELGLGDKLRAVLNCRKSAEALGPVFGFDKMPVDEPAVILFTSGSEAAPKGVPLSHKNLISDINGSYDLAGLKNDDIIYGFLPPFHSFGFTITGIFPLTSGLRVVYYPNPTESRKLVAGIAKWKPTIFCGTPTFLNGIFKAANPSQLDSVRLVISGAEKAPDELFEAAKSLDIIVVEGYGITETSPVLTVTPPGQPRVGVGQPIGDVQIKIVDPETREELALGERGLILACGSNIFKGYLAKDSSDAFHEMDGKRYYITGDLGFLDDAGNLTLSGRMKRFVKVGGEMISLPAMEDALRKKWPNDEEGNIKVAVSAKEIDGERPVLVLFSSEGISTGDANDELKAAGFSNLARLTKAIELDEIPLLGTGKTDYQSLKQKMIDELS